MGERARRAREREREREREKERNGVGERSIPETEREVRARVFVLREGMWGGGGGGGGQDIGVQMWPEHTYARLPATSSKGVFCAPFAR